MGLRPPKNKIEQGKYVEYNATMDYKMIRWASSQCRQVPWARPSSPTSSCAPMRIAIARRHAPSGILRVRSPWNRGKGPSTSSMWSCLVGLEPTPLPSLDLLERRQTWGIWWYKARVEGPNHSKSVWYMCIYIYKIYLIYIYMFFLQSGLRRINAEEVSQCPCPGYFPNHRQWYLNLPAPGHQWGSSLVTTCQDPQLTMGFNTKSWSEDDLDDLQNAPPFCWLCLLAFWLT